MSLGQEISHWKKDVAKKIAYDVEYLPDWDEIGSFDGREERSTC